MGDVFRCQGARAYKESIYFYAELERLRSWLELSVKAASGDLNDYALYLSFLN
jgi:hypothetical protein